MVESCYSAAGMPRTRPCGATVGSCSPLCPGQFSLFKRQAWQMLGLASVRGTSMTVGSEDADQVTLAIADQARADEAAAAAAAAATGAPVAAGAGAGAGQSNAFTPSGVSVDEAESDTVWSFDLENVYKSPSDASGLLHSCNARALRG